MASSRGRPLLFEPHSNYVATILRSGEINRSRHRNRTERCSCWHKLGPHLGGGAILDPQPHRPDRLQETLDFLAAVETIDNGKPIRETVNADLPLAVDHFRYHALCIRAHERSLSEIDHDAVAYHFSEPLGVVEQIIPWNFPLLKAAHSNSGRRSRPAIASS